MIGAHVFAALIALAAAQESDTPATQVTPAPPPAIADAKMDVARELAQLAYPAETLRAMNLRTWEAASRHALKLDPTTAALEKEYPGIGEAALNAGRPTARAGIDAFVTKMLERNAQIFATRLSPVEMKAAANMYRMPAVQKMLQAVLDGADLDPLAAEAAKSAVATGTPTIDSAAVRRTEQAAISRTAATLTPAEKTIVLRFQKTPWFPKLVAARTEIERRTLEAVNAPDPVWVEKQQNDMRDAMLAYMERGKAAAE
jgi:hypothetical protein